MWFSPLKEALDAFMIDTQRFVTGDVRLTFEAPGLMRITGRRSPHALYDYGLATYDAHDTFQHADSEGFVKIYGLGVKTWAARQGAKNATPRSS
jgi:argininosuccinate synthase